MSDRDSVITVDELDEGDKSGNGERVDWKKMWSGDGGNDRMDTGYRPYSGGRGNPQSRYGEELYSKVLHIQSKKFFIDVKESPRGRFVKLSEVSLNGMKNRMTLEMKVAAEFHDRLTDFIDEYASLGPRSIRSEGSRQKLKSFTLYGSDRRYFLDLKENQRGRFLKIVMSMSPPSYERSEILIPAQGMVDLRDVLTDVVQEFGKTVPKASSASQRDSSEGATSRSPTRSKPERKEESGLSMKATDHVNKTFYMAITNNKRGTHLRISEVCTNFRTAVNIPREIWPDFLKLLKKTAGMDNMASDQADTLDTSQQEFSDDMACDDEVIWTGNSIAAE